jgi:ABC-type sugar transport system ATPase subunit
MTVTITGLTKRYGATLALDGVDLEIRSGEVHALLGHNGAGKSTVIGCLGGRTAPTRGVIDIDGEQHTALDPRASIAGGVAVIYQHLSLIDSLTVAENLFLGQERTAGGALVRRREQKRQAADALARIGADISPDAVVGELSMGQRQQVEIAKALQRDARLLILDEPSAALSPVESQRLGELVLQLKSEGIAILYVTHLLNEVVRLADRATVLRNGRVVWSADMAGVSKADVVAAVSGGAHDARVAPPAPEAGEPALRLRGFAAEGLAPLDLDVQPGEIVCLYGLIGSGRTRLMETLFGRRPSRGDVRVDGRAVRVRTPDDALRAGVALVPADRAKQGLFGSLSASENIVTRAMGALGRLGGRDFAAERGLVARAFEAMSVRPDTPDLAASRFSGGNQQKILIGRWVNAASRVKVLLLDDPTQGVDVGARAEIYQTIRALAAERRVAIVYATNEPEEVLALAHRCVVMRDGAVVDSVSLDGADEESLLALIHHEPALA